MDKRSFPECGAPMRRRLFLNAAAGIGGFALAMSAARADLAPPPPQPPSPDPDDQRTSLHQEVDFTAKPQRIYDAILDSKQFAAFSGAAAQIDRREGGAFVMFGGKIVGRNIELVPARRIVQAWREAIWDPGVYSLVKFELVARGSGTRIVLDHTGFAPGNFGHLNAGWPKRYWTPLAKYLG